MMKILIARRLRGIMERVSSRQNLPIGFLNFLFLKFVGLKFFNETITPPPSPTNPCAGKHDGYEIPGGYSKCPNREILGDRIHLEIPGQCGGFIQCDNFQRAFCKDCTSGGLVFYRSVNPDACIWAYQSKRTDCN